MEWFSRLRIAMGRLMFNWGGFILCRIVEPILYCISGVYRHRKRIETGKETEFTAEVLQVIYKYPNPHWMALSIKSTIRLHCEFVKPDYVLQPHIKLMTYEEGLVYFAVCPPENNVYDLRKYPFLFLALPESCEQMVAMPLSELVKLGETVGSPKCQISWIFHLTRCGSTAVGQALNSVPGLTVLSENGFWWRCYSELIVEIGESWRSSEECQRLFRASLNMVMKDFTPETKLVVRAIGGCDHEFLLPYAIKHFPDSKFIYMYRDVKSVIESMWRVSGSSSEEDIKLKREASKKSEAGMQEYLKYIARSSSSVDTDALSCGDSLTVAHLILLAWTTNMRYFRIYGPRIKNLMVICFEDLVNDKQEQIAKVLDFLEIPKQYLTLAMDALMEDSQKGTMFGAEALKNAERWNPDSRTLEWCSMICQKYELPPFGKKFRIKRDLTFVIADTK